MSKGAKQSAPQGRRYRLQEPIREKIDLWLADDRLLSQAVWVMLLPVGGSAPRPEILAAASPLQLYDCGKWDADDSLNNAKIRYYVALQVPHAAQSRQLVQQLQQLREALTGSSDEHRSSFHDPLLERQLLLTSLRSYLLQTDKPSQPPPCALLFGEKGAGKSEVVRRLSQECSINDSLIVALQPDLYQRQLSQLATWLEGSSRASTTEELSSSSEADPGRLLAQRQQLVQRLNEALRSEGGPRAGRRLLLVADDLHLAGSMEQQLLATLYRQLATTAPGGVAFFCTAESSARSAIDLLLRGDAFDSMPPLILELPALTDAAARQLLVHLLGRQKLGTPQRTAMLIDKLIVLGGGNPTMLRLSLEYCLQKGTLPSAGVDALAVLAQAQFGPIEILAQRFEALAKRERELCTMLACLYNPLTLQELSVIGLLPAGDLQIIQRLSHYGFVRIGAAGVSLRYPALASKLLPLAGELAGEQRRKIVSGLTKYAAPSATMREELLLQRMRASGEATWETLDAAMALGADLEKSGAIPAALRIYLNAIEFLRRATPPDTIAPLKLAIELCGRLVNFGRFREAEIVLEAASGWRSATSSSEFTLKLLRQSARLKRFQGDFAASARLTEKGLQLATEVSDESEVLAFAALRAVLLLIGGEYQECLLKTEGPLSGADDLSEAFIQLLICRGHALRTLRHKDQAVEVYARGMRLAEKLGYAAGVANIEQSLALLDQSNGRLDAARDRFQRASELFRRSGNVIGEMSCKLTLAQLLHEAGEYGDSLDQFHDCLAFYRGVNNPRDLSDVLLHLGKLQLSIGHKNEGGANVRFALWLAEDKEFAHIRGLAHWLLLLAELRGDNRADARLHLDAALTVFSPDNMPHQYMKARIASAVLRDLDDGKMPLATLMSQFEEARELLDANELSDVFAVLFAAEVEASPLPWFTSFVEAQSSWTPRRRLETLYIYLRACERQNEAAVPTLLNSYFQLVENGAATLPEAMRATFLRFWRRDEFKQLQRKRPQVVRAVDEAPSLLARLPQQLRQLSQAENRSRLLQGAATMLLEACGAERIAFVYQRHAVGSVNDLLPNDLAVLKELPSTFETSGWARNRRLFSPRRDARVLEAFRLFATGEVGLNGTTMRDDLLLPLSLSNGLWGFVYCEGTAAANLSNRDERQLFAAMVAVQIAPLLYHLQPTEGAVAAVNEVASAPATSVEGSDSNEPFINASASMRQLGEMVDRLDDSESTVLIEGESGTGKELIARRIYGRSIRRDKVWYKVDCGGVAESLFEAQFFGYLKGSFTGAYADREGFFQAANGGTIFLDNVAELSLINQAKLLRAIQDREVRRVGATQAEKIDVRIMASSQRPLAELCAQGKFRLDLYYRLDVLHFMLPALRERRDDLPGLIEHFLKTALRKASAGKSKSMPEWQFSPEALQALQDYPWPGNVRELANEIERAVVQRSHRRDLSPQIGKEELSPKITALRNVLPTVAEELIRQTKQKGLSAMLDAIERNIIVGTLKKNHGNISITSKEFGVARASLRKRLKRLGITKS